MPEDDVGLDPRVRDLSPVLVTGASGLLGWNICRLLTESAIPFIAGCHSQPAEWQGAPSERFDIRDGAGVDRVFSNHKPRLVIHAAAISQPDKCEQDRDLSYAVNVYGTRLLADAAARHGARLVFVSTDLVFDGVSGMYRESDEPNPLNYYAKCKVTAEEVVKDRVPEWRIGRIALLYGNHGPALSPCIHHVVDALRSGREIRLFMDQFRSVLLADDAARGLLNIAVSDAPSHVFHLGGPVRCSRLAFALLVKRHFFPDGEEAKGRLVPSSSLEIPLGAPRPLDVSLDCSLAGSRIGWAPAEPSEGLDLTCRRHQSA